MDDDDLTTRTARFVGVKQIMWLFGLRNPKTIYRWVHAQMIDYRRTPKVRGPRARTGGARFKGGKLLLRPCDVDELLKETGEPDADRSEP